MKTYVNGVILILKLNLTLTRNIYLLKMCCAQRRAHIYVLMEVKFNFNMRITLFIWLHLEPQPVALRLHPVVTVNLALLCRIFEDLGITEEHDKVRLMTDTEDCLPSLVNLALTGHASVHYHNGNIIYDRDGNLLVQSFCRFTSIYLLSCIWDKHFRINFCFWKKMSCTPP